MADPSTNINDLPDELLLEVFSYLPAEDLGLNVQYVCTRWSDLCLDDVVWKDCVFNAEGNMSDYKSSVLEKLPKLQCFHLGLAPVQILHKLAVSCKSLRKLNLYSSDWNYGGSIEALKSLFSECTKLEEILVPDHCLANEELAALVGQLKYLRAISVFQLALFNPAILRYVAEGCPSLQYLDILHIHWQYSEMKYLLQKKKDQLLGLKISVHSFTGLSVLPLLVECKTRLRELVLSGSTCDCCFDTFASVRWLSTITSLKFRVCSNAPNIIKNAFKEGSMSQLLELEIRGMRINSLVVKNICNNCPNLLRLSIKSSVKLKDDVLQYLYKFTNLEGLDLSNCIHLTEAAMDHIVKCTKLKYLNISGCRKISKKGLVRLLELCELQHLGIAVCSVDGLPFDLFPVYLKKLRKLSVSHCRKINSRALAVLREKMPHLTVEPLSVLHKRPFL